jgi:hypothetical protein
MLKINGKDVIYSTSFVMKKGDDVVLTPPGVIGRSIKIVAPQDATAIGSGKEGFHADESDVHLTVLTVPFADDGHFVVELEQGQLCTVKGQLSCRIAGYTLGGNAMLVHFDLHEGRYVNYTGE